MPCAQPTVGEGVIRWLATKIVGQQEQRPEEGIPEGGLIPKHRDTAIYVGLDIWMCLYMSIYLYL